MGRNYGTTRIFAEKNLGEYLKNIISSVIQSIENESDDYLLNVNDSDYVKYKTSEAYIDLPEIHGKHIYASSYEKMILAESYSRLTPVQSGKSYRKNVIKFHVPFSGNAELFKCKPSRFICWTMDVELSNQEFCFEIINFNDDGESIKREKDSNLSDIMQQLKNVSSEVDAYNSRIESQIRQAFDKRKKRILANKGVLASLVLLLKSLMTFPLLFRCLLLSPGLKLESVNRKSKRQDSSQSQPWMILLFLKFLN